MSPTAVCDPQQRAKHCMRIPLSAEPLTLLRLEEAALRGAAFMPLHGPMRMTIHYPAWRSMRGVLRPEKAAL